MSTGGWIRQKIHDKLHEDLEHMKKVKRPAASKAIEKARALGDLKENAEYHAAKDAQGLLEAKIAQLEHRLATARILDGAEIDSDKIYLGATAVLRDQKSGREITYSVVTPEEADIKTGQISVESPVAKGLLGLAVGEIATIKVPAGELKYEVVSISR
ncbi:transcription elongation factor GreA [Candidatus Hydrogenedentota bacterium]